MATDIFLGKTKRSWARGDDVGSVVWPVKEQRVLFAKLDDLRYDIRGTKAVFGAALFALSGALAFLGIASVYRTASKDKRHAQGG